MVDPDKRVVEKRILDAQSDPSKKLVQFYEVNEKHQW